MSLKVFFPSPWKRRLKLLTCLLLLLFLIGWLISTLLPNPLGDFPHLPSVSAELAYYSQQAEKQTGVPWELLAAWYESLPISGQQAKPPSEGDVLALGKQLAASGSSMSALKKQISLLAGDKARETKIWELYREYTGLSYLYSPEPVFPVAKPEYFQDTWQADRDGGKRKHEGTDIFAKEGTPVYASTSGRIERLGWNSLGGERVGIRAKNGIYYYYAHLSGYAPNLKKGQYVSAGALIGYVGHTGNAANTPDHLHFGIMLPNGNWINPYNFLTYWQKYGNRIYP